MLFGSAYDVASNAATESMTNTNDPYGLIGGRKLIVTRVYYYNHVPTSSYFQMAF